jgi:serine/threonine-protein phosphatase 2A regulatory subunit B'
MKKLAHLLTDDFMCSFLDVFDTHDPRERDALKVILHSIYAYYFQKRSFIRDAMSIIFQKYAVLFFSL